MYFLNKLVISEMYFLNRLVKYLLVLFFAGLRRLLNNMKEYGIIPKETMEEGTDRLTEDSRKLIS